MGRGRLRPGCHDVLTGCWRLRELAKYTPNEVANWVGTTVGETARYVQTAVSEGRAAMRDREAKLRSTHHIESDARRHLRTGN